MNKFYTSLAQITNKYKKRNSDYHWEQEGTRLGCCYSCSGSDWRCRSELATWTHSSPAAQTSPSATSAVNAKQQVTTKDARVGFWIYWSGQGAQPESIPHFTSYPPFFVFCFVFFFYHKKKKKKKKKNVTYHEGIFIDTTMHVIFACMRCSCAFLSGSNTRHYKQLFCQTLNRFYGCDVLDPGLGPGVWAYGSIQVVTGNLISKFT